MTEARCEADIGHIAVDHTDRLAEWLTKFESTCAREAGHTGEHVFAADQVGEALYWDDLAGRYGVY